MIFIRVAGIFFAFVQITLALRLLLPFVDVPFGLGEFVPTLMAITDAWLAPFVAIFDRLDITNMAGSLEPTTVESGPPPEDFELIVVAAMIGWGIIAGFSLFVMKLIFRPAG